MNWLLDVLRCLAAWWREGLVAAGMPALQEHEWSTSGDLENNAEADREAWETERARLVLSPWWL
jgi:hypothetical protein